MKYLKEFKIFECNVCRASVLLDGKTLTQTFPNGDTYEIKGEAEAAEFKPGFYQLRKNNGEWTEKFPTDDLAGEVSRGSFDIKPQFAGKQTIEWLEGHFN